MLIDEAIINVEGGKGGDGLASFRREKYVPKGGPDGGDGGKGGNVVIEMNNATHGLGNYKGKHYFKAEDGADGRTTKKTGKSGEDLILTVPPGTVVFDNENNNILWEFVEDKKSFVIAKGGRGGWGNTHFTTATHQAPEEFNQGITGQKFNIKLVLKLIADVGLIGLPNAGKSTLLSHISEARPKIADYPFTTLEPHLGAVNFRDRQIIFADIPGLIEGASEGRGLGHKFLQHIERTKILVHLLDATREDLLSDYKTIRKELENYSHKLTIKPEIVVINKIDTIPEDERSKLINKLSKQIKIPVLGISGVSGENIKLLLKKIYELLF